MKLHRQTERVFGHIAYANLLGAMRRFRQGDTAGIEKTAWSTGAGRCVLSAFWTRTSGCAGHRHRVMRCRYALQRVVQCTRLREVPGMLPAAARCRPTANRLPYALRMLKVCVACDRLVLPGRGWRRYRSPACSRCRAIRVLILFEVRQPTRWSVGSARDSGRACLRRSKSRR